MNGQSEWFLCTLSILQIEAQIEATFGWLGSWCTELKIEYDLLSYALHPAKFTSAKFMGPILEEYLVRFVINEAAWHTIDW